MSELREIVLCKDCIHRPTIIECEDDVKDDIEFPDKKCPCQCEDDCWYSKYTDDVIDMDDNSLFPQIKWEDFSPTPATITIDIKKKE